MKVIGINGSPRKKWNTSTLLEKALEGAASEGAETELIHLYDLNFKTAQIQEWINFSPAILLTVSITA